MENKIGAIKEWFQRPLSVVWFCGIISLFTLIAYHKPLFDYVTENVESGLSGVVITISFALLMLLFEFMFAMLVIKPLRMVGRVIVALSLLANGAALYFINTYEV